MKHFFFLKKTLQVAEFFIAMQQPKLKKKHIFHSFFFLEILSRPKSLLLICPFLKNYRANIFETKKKTLTPSKGKLTFFLLKKTKQTVPTWLI